MNILSIDTTTKVASVAILKDGKIIANNISNEITHSEKLLPLINDTLKQANITLKDINVYAVINGPGSFTGIRIGLATLKAFTMLDNKKIFSVTSIDLIAYKAFVEKVDKINKELDNINNYTYIFSLIDAKNDRVYYNLNKVYKNNENKVCIENVVKTSNELIDIALENIKNEIQNSNTLDINNNIYIAGDCVEKFEDKITNLFNLPILYNTYPTTSDLIHAYCNINSINDYLYDTYTLDATYARASQAERLQENEK